MNAWIRLGLGFLISIGLARPFGAQIEDFDGKRMAARAGVVTALEEHSEWCRAKKMFLAREATMELLLLFDPGHAESLKALGFKRERDGSWSPPKRPKKFKDFSANLSEEASQRLEAALQGFLGDMHTLLADPNLTRDQRLLIFEEILPVDPDDPTMRAERGEVKAGDAWVLRETVDSKSAREQVTAALAQGAAHANFEAGLEPNPLEAGLGLTWTAVLQTPEARVLGTVEQDELEEVSLALSRTLSLYRSLFLEGARPPMGFTAFLLGDPDERTTFLGAYPNLPDEDRERMAQFSSTWIDRRNHVAVWMESREERLDGLVRLLVSQLLARDFRISQDHSWIHEGFGLYITEAVTGTRITWYVQPEDAEAEDGESIRRILTGSTDWRAAAVRLFGGAHRPRMGALIEKRLASFELTDLLHSYVVAAYLAEGFPGLAPKVASAIGIGKAPRPILEEALGRSLDETDGRVLRWLGETGHGTLANR